MGSTERSPQPDDATARSRWDHQVELILGSIGVSIVGFLAGLMISPFKGEVGIGFAASAAFTSWVIWSWRASGRKASAIVIVATLVVAIPLIFIFVGYMHTVINY